MITIKEESLEGCSFISNYTKNGESIIYYTVIGGLRLEKCEFTTTSDNRKIAIVLNREGKLAEKIRDEFGLHIQPETPPRFVSYVFKKGDLRSALERIEQAEEKWQNAQAQQP